MISVLIIFFLYSGEKNWVCKNTITDGHTRSIRSVAWSFCGTRLVSGGFDAKVSIWERQGQDFVLQTTLEGHENEVKDVAFSRSGLYLATCGRDKSVWIWECKFKSIETNFLFFLLHR
jgi:WD40 repeat protein